MGRGVRKLLGVLGVLALAVTTAEAKTLYVSAATGNDSTTYANNTASTPWATIARAAWGSTNRGAPNSNQAARAGDVVVVAAGTYNFVVSGSGRFDPLYNPVNSGAPGQPITFVVDGRVVLRSTSWNGPVIGANTRDYIIWDGFYIDEANINVRADTGPVTVYGSNNVTIQNLEIDGHAVSFDPTTENHNGIRVENSNHTRLYNNLIYDIRVSGHSGHHNHAGIMLYDANDTIIEHNEIRGSGAGIFVKGLHSGHTQARNILRYNLIHSLVGSAKGIILLASTDGKIYQNVVRGGNAGVSIFSIGSGPTEHPIRDIIANNVFDRTANGVLFEGSTADWVNIRFWNNIVTNSSSYAIGAEEVADPLDIDFEHNVYFTFPVFAWVQGNMTFSTWKSRFGEDGVSPPSITSNPMFVDAASGDYRLQAGSPALALGRVIGAIGGVNGATIAAGAYITGNEVIGRLAEDGPTAPAAPSNLRIIDQP
jgi:hypothetical protein